MRSQPHSYTSSDERAHFSPQSQHQTVNSWQTPHLPVKTIAQPGPSGRGCCPSHKTSLWLPLEDCYLHLSGFSAVANIFRNTSRAFTGHAQTGSLELEQIPALAERGKLQLEDLWPRLETRLAQSEWVAGDNFSFADIDLYCMVEFAAWAKAGIPEDAGRLQAWHQRARDSM